jgi:hypothetical protein
LTFFRRLPPCAKFRPRRPRLTFPTFSMTSSVGTPLSSPDMVRDSPDRARSRRRQSDGNAARNRLRRRVSFKLHLDLAALFRRIRATSGKPQSAQTGRPRLARRERGLKGQHVSLPHPRPGSTRHIWRRSFALLLNRRTPAAFDRRSPRGEPPSLDLHAMNRPSLSARRRVRQGSFAAPGRGIHVGSRARPRGCTKSESPPLSPGSH